ncbi:CREB-regulated transcription coactivator 1-like isoform X7 [Athalia rosae]|uniref:CREB-regulated transcription coactivator 1-like isoform X7 n=1 Tax=Athalia rosae TaxID=37344 RepID=UPI000A0EDDA9|nr:CREB-regulated transcription coactivator 1-like isoform X7 [Athalia rosae]
MANPRKFSEKIALLNQKQAEETAAFEAIMREVSDVTSRTALNHPEEIQNNSMMYRTTSDRSRSVGGPMRSRPAEKRHDTSPYSGVPYLSPPPPDTWRRTNSDSALHQSVNESCQMPSSMPHRRGSDAYPHMGVMGNEHRDSHRGFMERPRSSCEMPRVPGINIYPSSQPPGQQIPIGNNTGSLPDLSNVHFPPPLQAPLDQEEHSSSTPYSNSPQTSSPTTLSPTSLQQAGRLSFSQDHSPAHAQNHLSVPVNSRFLHTCKGVALDNSTSTSQQDLHSYTQPPPPAHSPQHFIYQPPHSPVPPPSPKSSQSHQPVNSLGSYRTPQTVNRPSPQSSPSLTVRSPLSYSNNPSAPPSPTGHLGQPNFTTNSLDQNNYLPDQNQAAALQQHFEQFSMGVDWAHLVQQLMESGCAWTTQLEMDSPVAPTSGTYISSPSHTSYTQSEMINVGGEMGGGDAGYFSTSPQLAYQPRTPTSSQQLTPQTPNTPTIILTDFSGNHGLSSSEYVKDYHGTEMTSDFDQNLFPSDDALRQGLDPIDFGDLQMLTDPDMVIDPTAEDHFRLDRL